MSEKTMSEVGAITRKISELQSGNYICDCVGTKEMRDNWSEYFGGSKKTAHPLWITHNKNSGKLTHLQ